MQETVWQVGRLFLDHEASGQAALLPMLLEEEGVSGELLFGALLDKPDSNAAPEAEAWKVRHNRAFAHSVSQRAQRNEGFFPSPQRGNSKPC